YVTEGLRDGAATIVIATEPHLKALEREWERVGFHPDGPTAQGQLVMLDAVQTLGQFMAAGRPDRELFGHSVGEIVARAAERYGRIAAFGEMVSVLWADGNPTAAIELESLWNELTQRYRLTLFCAYALRDCTADGCDSAFEQVCAAHTRVIPAESYPSGAPGQQQAAIAQLQRKANA